MMISVPYILNIIEKKGSIAFTMLVANVLGFTTSAGRDQTAQEYELVHFNYLAL